MINKKKQNNNNDDGRNDDNDKIIIFIYINIVNQADIYMIIAKVNVQKLQTDLKYTNFFF